MKQTKVNEKGAIIIEVIAVIALLGVLGPLLFRQVLSRNEEVDNINLASEIRSVKEAFSAYILTNKQSLYNTAGCSVISDDVLVDYMPYGMSDVAGDYRLVLCGIAPETTAAPTFLQGFIVPQNGVFPEDMNLKQTARIATLIGADGGIYQNGSVNGTGGAWGISADELTDASQLGTLGDILEAERGRYIYLATTGMDTYVPEYIVEDYSSGFVTIPDNLAFQKLHAAQYFSIGNGGESCYKKNHNTMEISKSGYTAQNDDIYGVGGGAGNDCDPLFWVGASGTTTDHSEAGRVYVKNGSGYGC